MKLLSLVLALGVVGACSALIPVQPMVPVHPKHTFEEWEAIMDAQVMEPERCDGCVEGKFPQPDVAGVVAVRSYAGSGRIIGGSEASPGQFPWQVQVRMDDSYFCGGSIISKSWILSAGHCASGYSRFVIVMGTTSSSINDPSSISIASREGYAHEKYNPWQISDDISVIKLPRNIPSWTDLIRPVRLPKSSQSGTSFAGVAAVLSGWGRNGTNTVSPTISPVLLYVKLQVMANEDCARYFGSSIRATNLCTAGGTSSPVGACNGDSGGALNVDDNGVATQVGIVSFGTSMGCNRKYPSAYTRVTAYLKWISDKTGIAIQS